jgi:dihydrofolate reductase
MLIGIIAISKNFAIGRGGKLPWHYSEDLKFFKRTTVGNVVVMGSTTWRSIGKALPERENIVLSRSTELELPDGVLRMSSVDEVIEFDEQDGRDVFVIGGASVYKAFADVIDRWIVTEIPETIDDADTFMPRDFLDEFEGEDVIDLEDNLRVRILHRRRD